MSWHLPPAVSSALKEATRRWPKRSRRMDGTIGDVAHSARTSDHNPDERGAVLAFDLTHDPASGCDAHALIRAAVARRDPRVKYAISQGRIWSKKHANHGWRPYKGSNPHERHAHISVDHRFENDVSPWWPAPPTPEPTPVEDDMQSGFLFDDGEHTYLRDGGDTIHLPEPDDIARFQSVGYRHVGKLSAELTARLIESAKQ